MGKPFKSELARLAETYAWAMEQDVQPLANFVQASVSGPVSFLGSGGSFSAASFGAYLHEQLTTQVGEALTPLQFSARSEFSSTAVLMMSAGGKNQDILTAYRTAIQRDTKRLGVICFDPNSALFRLANRVWITEMVCKPLPVGSDGFLATNSLLAFFVLILRAYHEAGLLKVKLPETAQKARSRATWSQRNVSSALSRPYLIVCSGHIRARPLSISSRSYRKQHWEQFS